MSKHLIRLTHIYDLFGIDTEATWYMLAQLRRIDISFLMCSWFDLDWLSCMSSWFDPGGMSLVCIQRLTKAFDVRNILIGID